MHAELEADLVRYIESLDPAVLSRETMEGPVLKHLSGGHHNANYRLSFPDAPDRAYVVRFCPGEHHQGDIVALEYEHMRTLDASLAPKAYFLGKPPFLSGSLMIQQFVEGEHKPYVGMAEPDIDALAGAFARLHSIVRTEPGLATYLDAAAASIHRGIDLPLKHVRLREYPDAHALLRIGMPRLDEMLQEEAGLFATETLSLVHGDPGPGNVVWQGRDITFIDWSESFYGDPADEVAALFAMNHVSQAFKERFLAAYLAVRPDASLAERVRIYMLKNRLADLAWSLKQLEHDALGTHSALVKKDSEVYRGYYDVRFKALRKTLEEYGLLLRN